MYQVHCTPQNIVEAIYQEGYDEQKMVMLWLAESEQEEVDDIIHNCNKHNILLFGGIFPSLIYKKTICTKGAIIKVLPTSFTPLVIQELADISTKVPDYKALASKQTLAIVLVDGLANNITTFLGMLFSKLGNTVNYFGGGAGYSDWKQRKCIFTNEGFFKDAGVVAFVDLPSKLSVKSGWSPLIGPLVATKTAGNVIKELNWQNALEVYSEMISEYMTGYLTPTNFFEVAKSFPFGIYRAGEENITRTPIQVNARQELVCLGDVPENTVLSILGSENEQMIQAAQEVMVACLAENVNKVKHQLVVNGITRKLILGDNSIAELATINEVLADHEQTAIIEGIYALGEIASNGQGFLEFFNKTIVTTALYGKDDFC